MRERGSPRESASRIGRIIGWPCGGKVPIIKGGFAVSFSPGDSGWIRGRNPGGMLGERWSDLRYDNVEDELGVPPEQTVCDWGCGCM